MRIVNFKGLTVAALALALGACGGHPSAVPAKAPGGGPAASAASGTTAPGPASTPLVGGKPAWAANRKHTAEENAQFQFGKNGADFAAASEADYVQKAHAFIDNPPAGAETLNRRNGDRLIYDARSNVFAVVTKDGAPRTMFKPRDGAAYWAQQKAREASRTSGGGDNTDS